jgi:heme/copper-type cytochrome/quinol oxidase subunit 4
MRSQQSSLWAYLATLVAIVVMTIAAAVICVAVDAEKHLAQIVAALGFIGAAVTGLIGVIGTFRPRHQLTSEEGEKP